MNRSKSSKNLNSGKNSKNIRGSSARGSGKNVKFKDPPKNSKKSTNSSKKNLSTKKLDGKHDKKHNSASLFGSSLFSKDNSKNNSKNTNNNKNGKKSNNKNDSKSKSLGKAKITVSFLTGNNKNDKNDKNNKNNKHNKSHSSRNIFGSRPSSKPTSKTNSRNNSRPNSRPGSSRAAVSVKKSKQQAKVPSIENIDGYEHIARAYDLQNDRKFKSAIKELKLGIPKLENYVKTIDNAMAKRERMKQIDEYRQQLLKLENKQRQQKDAKQRKKVEKENKEQKESSNSTMYNVPITEHEAYESVIRAKEFEQQNQLQQAYDEYAKCIPELESFTLKIGIKSLKDAWKEEIASYRHKQRRLKIQIDEELNASIRAANSKNEVSRAKSRPLQEEPGYQLIVKAESFEKSKNWDTAITYYQKGITKLEETLHDIDNGIEKRERMKKINEYRHAMQRLKNLKTRDWVENGGGFGGVPRHRAGSGQMNVKIFKESSQSKIKSPIARAPSFIPTYGGKLFNIVKEGRLRARTLESCDTNDLYHILPLVLASIAAIPQTFIKTLRDPLVESFNKRVDSSQLLEQRFRMFLYSHRDSDHIMDIWRDHPCNPSVIDNNNNMKPNQYQTNVIIPSTINEDDSKSSSNNNGTKLPPSMQTYALDNNLNRANLKLQSTASNTSRPGSARNNKTPSYRNINGGGRFSTNGYFSEFSDVETDNEFDTTDGFNSPNNGINSEFEAHYLERDVIYWLHNLLESNPSPKTEHEIDHDITIFNLLPRGKSPYSASNGSNDSNQSDADSRVHMMRVEKVFNSNAKPLLVTMHHNSMGLGSNMKKYRQIGEMIVKMGDDLRKDACVLFLFSIMNAIWDEENLYYDGYPIRCLIYNVLPMGSEFGAIERIKNVLPLRDVLNYKEGFGESQLKNLVASTAASCVASYVIGVRDRHFDNVLIRNDGTLFHIDFGFVFGEKLFLDASKMAITSDLQQLMGEEHWNNFINIGTMAYMALRWHFLELSEWCNIIFKFIDMKTPPIEHLKKSLQIGVSDEKAKEKIMNKFGNAPHAWNTILKNKMHGIATGGS